MKGERLTLPRLLLYMQDKFKNKKTQASIIVAFPFSSLWSTSFKPSASLISNQNLLLVYFLFILCFNTSGTESFHPSPVLAVITGRLPVHQKLIEAVTDR